MDDLARKKRNLWMYPLGTVGRDMVYSLFTNYLLTFVLFTRVLTTAQIAAITGIMIAARIFDAFNDPIMGNIIERTRSKWGKFKPWLVAGILSTSVVVYLLFNTKLQGSKFIWFFGFSYFMFSITYTMHDISYWGMVPAFSSDTDSRNQFTSRATLFAGIGGTIASIIIPMLTTGQGALGGNTSTAYGFVALGICILSPLFCAFTIFGAKENRDDQNKPAPKVSFGLIFKTIRNNDQLLWISLIFIIQGIGNGIVVGGVGSTYIYFEFGYRGGLYSLFNTIGLAATAFLMVFYPAISRKLPRKKLMGIMQIASIVGYFVMIVVGFGLKNTEGSPKFILITLAYMIANFGQYCFYLVMMISLINTVEYNEYKFGQRSEAIITSLRPFITKLSSAIIVGITSLIYIFSGCTLYTNQISDLESQASRGLITEAVKLTKIDQVISSINGNQTSILLLSITVVPLIFMLVSYFLYKKFYKLDEPVYEEICAKLREREAK